MVNLLPRCVYEILQVGLGRPRRWAWAGGEFGGQPPQPTRQRVVLQIDTQGVTVRAAAAVRHRGEALAQGREGLHQARLRITGRAESVVTSLKQTPDDLPPARPPVESQQLGDHRSALTRYCVSSRSQAAAGPALRRSRTRVSK